MNISSPYGASGILFNSNSQVPLVEGQTIKVDVIKNNGDGTCLVSFGGGKFNIKTRRTLEAGDSFAADVSFMDGKVHLTPSDERLFSSSFIRFMESSGFVPDGITAKILQFMEQSGVMIDRKFMQKAHSVALNFPGNEKAAGEIACMLLEKGIEPSEDKVRELLLLLDSREVVEDQSGGNGSAYEGDGKKQAESKGDGDLQERLYSVQPVRKEGLLAFLNHCRIRNSQKHWIVLPYEWQMGKKNARGLIRILINPDLETTEKLQINCEISCKKYYFMVYYEESKVKEVRFCSLPPLLTSEIKNEEKRLGELFCSGMNGDSVPVTYSALAYSEGLYSSSEIPFSFEDIA